MIWINAFRNLYRMYADDGRILGFATGENEQKAFERFRDASNFKGNVTALQMTFGYPSDVCEVVEHNCH
jgi:hypothetical protein